MLRARGIIYAEVFIEDFGVVDEVSHCGWLRGDPDQFVVEGSGNALMESIHLCILIGPGMGSIGGPFLVPFVKGFTTHSKVVHHVGGMEDGVSRDKMCMKGSFKFRPGAKMNGIS